ncbi:hypothetical protein EDB80DRAFT_879035 [Ilyonectria destructans]|nr:hypothetical protein EDB80DRAFT_879035 [Ilyonectria destructans]
MTQRFPLSRAPICLDCSHFSDRRVTSDNNPHGHAGRPFYFCNRFHKFNFITWDDARGIISDNPQCWCGHLSRRNRKNGPSRTEWYACASGGCKFKQDLEENDPVELEGTPTPSTPPADNVSPVSDVKATDSRFSSGTNLGAIPPPTTIVYDTGTDIHSLDKRIRDIGITLTTQAGSQGSPPPTSMVPTWVQRFPNVDYD